MKCNRKWAAAMALSLALSSGSIAVGAHSGRTDGNGGHNNRKTGGYHYHHGYAEHQHPDGICPYDTPKKTTKAKTTKSTTSKKDINKKYQKLLQEKGYDCGTPDGIVGKKTIAAIKKFQQDKGLKVTGTLNEETKKALES